MKSLLHSGISRRRFLAATGAAIVAPTIIPASALGRGETAPSERITIGGVGWGSIGPENIRSLLAYKDCQVVAYCDLDKNRLQHAIGKVTRVEVGLPAGHADESKMGDKMKPSEPPPEIDYPFWIGPSTMVPYIEARVHYHWRWNYNTGGGQLLDWIGHHCDIAHWGMDMDDGGPSEIEGHGEFPPKDDVWNTATRYRITSKYPKDIE